MFEVRLTDVFEQWLDGLADKRAAAKVAQQVIRLRHGLFGDVRPVGEAVSELRIDFGPGYRVYFVQRGKLLILLLCGGDKGSQPRDIARAKLLAAEWESSNDPDQAV